MTPGKHEYKCMVVDDNRIDRLTTISYLRKYPFLTLAGSFGSAAEALPAIAATPPDVLFLDIDMPDMSGLELRSLLPQIPACIFISSYPEYAIQGFEVNALDFLVKPIDGARFETSMKRLQYFLEVYYKAELMDHSLNPDSIFIKDGHEHVKIQSYNILYLEALKDYTGIMTKTRKYCVLAALGNLLKEDPFQRFIRIHRSYAVQKQFIRKLTPKAVMVDDVLLPVGRSYKDAVEKLLID